MFNYRGREGETKTSERQQDDGTWQARLASRRPPESIVDLHSSSPDNSTSTISSSELFSYLEEDACDQDGDDSDKSSKFAQDKGRSGWPIHFGQSPEVRLDSRLRANQLLAVRLLTPLDIQEKRRRAIRRR